jgi:hypothetical protein
VPQILLVLNRLAFVHLPMHQQRQEIYLRFPLGLAEMMINHLLILHHHQQQL